MEGPPLGMWMDFYEGGWQTVLVHRLVPSLQPGGWRPVQPAGGAAGRDGRPTRVGPLRRRP